VPEATEEKQEEKQEENQDEKLKENQDVNPDENHEEIPEISQESPVEERDLLFHEVSLRHRADIIYHICQQKLSQDDYIKEMKATVEKDHKLPNEE
jgi:hypothetical protein